MHSVGNKNFKIKYKNIMLIVYPFLLKSIINAFSKIIFDHHETVSKRKKNTSVYECIKNTFGI